MKDKGKKSEKSNNKPADACSVPRKKGTNACAEKKSGPTHEQISERAYILWQQNGCLPEQEEKYWLLAEEELKKENSK